MAVQSPCWLVLSSNGWADFISNPVLPFEENWVRMKDDPTQRTILSVLSLTHFWWCFDLNGKTNAEKWNWNSRFMQFNLSGECMMSRFGMIESTANYVLSWISWSQLKYWWLQIYFIDDLTQTFQMSNIQETAKSFVNNSCHRSSLISRSIIPFWQHINTVNFKCDVWFP